LFDEVREFFDLFTTEYGIGALVVVTVVAIGLAFYGARRLEEN
jgi:hypothetical protein